MTPRVVLITGGNRGLGRSEALVFTATPGSESAEKLRLLAVLGRQSLRT